ncbi:MULTISPECIES: endonuclease/exonuclease/phosphatase family protein [unclassified Sulfitobacter]|jgi:endonuclease/exonuclease/phosphatase (EEP) superfamily protein YafD|uniref:endonuclease/exonuclease/phosphatase family protein n=1 Tax=unclassified Sulfitobacter TaxID=196795 RepID=UPI001593E07F|nr:endonuclease/exonuclease/phosphatase family protein [Sulfitobacter sp. HGT1]
MPLLHYLFWFGVAFLFLASVLPFSRIAHGAIRGLAFPRQQFFVLTLAMIPVALVGTAPQTGVFAIAVLVISAAVHVGYIVKFTPVWSQQSMAANLAELGDTDTHITLIAANVKQSNRDYQKLIDLIISEKPDIATALEVDQAWMDAIYAGLKDHYAHWVKVPKSNSYGIVLMSNLPLSETQVRELLVEDVPSIRTRVQTRSGRDWRLYIIHPEPPVPNHDTKGRDGEIALTGIEAGQDELPVVVTGDLNDVAWSAPTRRFQRLSGLLDPRVGRGLYNTFHAGIPFLRWPLDHLFHSADFRLIRMDRLRHIGSDHFPILFTLALTRTKLANSTPGPSDAAERDEVREIVQEELQNERQAIGTDWEKD